MPGPESLVVAVVRAFKQDLEARDALQMGNMAAQWRRIEEYLQAHIDSLVAEIMQRRVDGASVSITTIRRLDRYHDLRDQVVAEVTRYQRTYAEGLIIAEQERMIQMGIEHAATAIRVAGVSSAFDVIPTGAVEVVAGLAGDGKPLFAVLQGRALAPESVQGLTDALVRGTALGWNPRKTARAMQDGLAQGLQKALVLARTEQLRAYRMATTAEYRESGVVTGFRRMAAKGGRTCLACLLEDGRVYRLESEMEDHPAGRCTACPIVESMPMPQWQTGREWLQQQDPEAQRVIMGDARYQLWREGKVPLERMAYTAHSDTWGDSPAITPLSRLTEAA
jgi:hypothetical protein